jgi:hypothetical protein
MSQCSDVACVRRVENPLIIFWSTVKWLEICGFRWVMSQMDGRVVG